MKPPIKDGGPHTSQAAARIAFVLRAVIGLGFVALWLLCRRGEERPAELAAVFATVPLGILLLSEISLTTHHVVPIVPCAVILLRALDARDEAARSRLWAVGAALAVCMIGMSKTVRMLSPLLVATLILLAASVALVLADRKGSPLAGSSDCRPTTPR